jgi:phage tail tape-measure protein
LTAKLDPKAQLRESAGRMKERVSATAGEVTGKVTNKTGEVTSKVTHKTGEVTSKVADKTGTAGQQLRGSAAKAARNADQQRVPLAVAAGVAVLLGAAWIVWVMRRR